MTAAQLERFMARASKSYREALEVLNRAEIIERPRFNLDYGRVACRGGDRGYETIHVRYLDKALNDGFFNTSGGTIRTTTWGNKVLKMMGVTE